MSDIYLNQEKKDYYYSDFNENVLPETDDFWKVHEFIKPYLIQLNENKKIQSLYSKFPKLGDDKSYLDIAYFKEIESQLFRNILPHFIYQYNQTNQSRFYYNFSEPKDNPEFNPDSRFKLGCFHNPDYFRINTYKFTFENLNQNFHKEFWKDLTTKLKEIK